jgi:hypothetical protein
MQKRSLFRALTAGVLIWGFGALEARAETLTLSVFAGTDTTAPAIYSVVGGSTAVSADTGILNGNLAAGGFGAYSFSNLGGSSNNPGSSLLGPLGGAYILTSGNLIVTPGGSGESTPITVTLTEGGFVLPTSSPSLVESGTVNFAGATGSLDSTGVLTDATGAATTVSIPTLTETSIPPSSSASTSPGTYVTPFTLDSQTTLVLDAATGLNGSNGFSQKVQLIAASSVPEPASLVMMLTGMPLPLVVMGLLRRRRAAA